MCCILCLCGVCVGVCVCEEVFVCGGVGCVEVYVGECGVCGGRCVGVYVGECVGYVGGGMCVCGVLRHYFILQSRQAGLKLTI